LEVFQSKETNIFTKSAVWLVPSFRTPRAKFPGIVSSNSQISHRHIFQALIQNLWDLKIRFFKRRGSILTKKKQRGWLNKIPVRILLCYMYNGAVLKGNIYYLHSRFLSMSYLHVFRFKHGQKCETCACLVQRLLEGYLV
jgi:hypothetical protein